jgi:hypothetical protein
MTKATMAFSICTWAPTAFVGPKIVRGAVAGGPIPDTTALRELAAGYVRRLEALGITHMLIAQRWWGSGEEMEGSTLDCLAMTAYFAAVSERLQLITAIHPGFFQPAVIAKWGATMDRLTGGRWAINVTSGWHLREFAMYGVDPLPHDERYVRATEFIEVLRGAWTHEAFDYRGRYFNATALQLEPRPTAPLVVYQGGQSNAAIAMAACATLRGRRAAQFDSRCTRSRYAGRATPRRGPRSTAGSLPSMRGSSNGASGRRPAPKGCGRTMTRSRCSIQTKVSPRGSSAVRTPSCAASRRSQRSASSAFIWISGIRCS